jgi:hypothetical protein
LGVKSARHCSLPLAFTQYARGLLPGNIHPLFIEKFFLAFWFSSQDWKSRVVLLTGQTGISYPQE